MHANRTVPAAPENDPIVNEDVSHLVTPVAPQRPHVWDRPTGPVSDSYAWMRDVADQEFLDYLTTENDFTDAFFAPNQPLIETLFDEIKSRVQETDMSTPVPYGNWWYVSRTEEGSSYPSHHRGATRETADAILLLDENVEAAGHPYFDLGTFDASQDHSMFAWSADTKGDERYTLRFRSVTANGGIADLDDEIGEIANAGTGWSQDGTTLFYVRADEQERPYQVWRHTIGEAVATDTLVYEETDDRFFVKVGETRSNKWIVIHTASKTSSEVRLIDSSAIDTVHLVAARRDDVEYQVDHWGDRFVITTNENAVDFRVLTAPVEQAWGDNAEWSELIAHTPGNRIVGAEPFDGFLVVKEWVDAQPRLRLIFADPAQPEHIIDGGDAPHDIALSANPEYMTSTIRFVTNSMTTPRSVFDEHVLSGKRTLLRQLPTPNVNLDSYTSTRTWAPSADGTAVPVDVVHHIDTALDGTAPGVIYGYGAYEVSLAPWFSVARLSLLDRGMVFAVAHPRGGGELGRRWYLDGKLENKQHSFDDMIAAVEHLVHTNVVDAERVAIRGGSAGGLLVGACMTQRPDLFASVIAEVPFVDIVNTMSDPTLPLTITEWEEWGDPRSEPFASTMASYSPYDNTVAQRYPALYVTAGLTDPRVSVHEPAKWVARLREVGSGQAPIVLRTKMEAGHGGPTGRYDAWRDEAQKFAFLIITL